jgi:hypothetical protein
MIESSAAWPARAHFGCDAFGGYLMVFGGVVGSAAAAGTHPDRGRTVTIAPTASFLDDIWASEINSCVG